MSEDKKVIELRVRDLKIAEYNGSEVVQIKGGTAFDEEFIEECKSKGVKRVIDLEEEKEEEETEE